jgi:MFS family permease
VDAVRSYPGYLVTQIPAGYLIQRFGAKVLLTVNMIGTAMCTMVLPLTLSGSAPISLTWLALTISGMFQGSLIPGHQDMKRHWLPSGPGRAVANRIIGIGHSLNALLSTSLTPMLAERLGWRAVLRLYGLLALGFAGVWHAVATDRPASCQLEPQPPPAEKAALGTAAVAAKVVGEGQAAPAPEKVFEPRIFTVPAVLVAVGCKGTAGLPEYCLTQWLPTEFASRFGSTNTVRPSLALTGHSCNS